METLPIRTNNDLAAALARIDDLWGSEPGTPEGDELDVLLALVGHYENEHFSFASWRSSDHLKLSRQEAAKGS